LLLVGSGLEVSLAHGPTPRDETRYQLAVAAVWGAKAFPELTFFQRELEGELSQVEGSDQHESPASGEQRRTYYQAEVPVVERVTHVGSPGCHLQTLRENTRAVRFFERMGFAKHGPSALVPGLRDGGKRVHQQTMVWRP
jgi:hypothetical protein